MTAHVCMYVLPLPMHIAEVYMASSSRMMAARTGQRRLFTYRQFAVAIAIKSLLDVMSIHTCTYVHICVHVWMACASVKVSATNPTHFASPVPERYSTLLALVLRRRKPVCAAKEREGRIAVEASTLTHI